MSDRFSRILPFVATIALGIGIVLTSYGFYSLATNGDEGGPWRKSEDYLVMFLWLWLMTSLLGIWRGPFIAGLLVALLITVAAGVMIPVAVIILLTLSAYILGRLLLRKPEVAATDNLLAGIVVFGSLLGLLVHLPINTPGTWGLLFTLPILIGWRHVQTLWTSIKILSNHTFGGAHRFLLHCAILSAASLHFLVSLMPEIGHDALAMHLFAPVYVAYHKSWHFDAETYVWAVMPMLIDWLYTAGYLLAGEIGARLVNTGGVFLLAAVVYRIGRWTGAGEVPAAWGTLLLLVTPLTFTESSSLFVEGMWSAMVLGGTLALMRLMTTEGDTTTTVLLSGLLLGGAVASKAVTFTILPVLGLVVIIGYRLWFSKDILRPLTRTLLIFVGIGIIPYATAYALTGNPVFPFFNEYFQSPFYPSVNFKPSPVFARGLSWDTLYSMTFESKRYMESTPGASGFQWIALVIPALIVLGTAGHRRALLLSLMALGWMWLTFQQVAYLRYVLPSFGLACVLVAAALSAPALNHRWTRHAWTTTAVLVVVLNLVHFNSGTYYGEIDLAVITNREARETYIQHKVPVRWAANIINELNFGQRPVAVFSAPVTGGLRSEALYPCWYNFRFFEAARAATTHEEMGRLLARHNVRYVVLDEKWDLTKFFPVVKDVTIEVARNQTVSVRRLDKQYR
ncbi:MAG: hypothetical protein OEY86_04985 [Nitrospira sp.]|nr:hypothetical protein [Nitrospira sp.]